MKILVYWTSPLLKGEELLGHLRIFATVRDGSVKVGAHEPLLGCETIVIESAPENTGSVVNTKRALDISSAALTLLHDVWSVNGGRAFVKAIDHDVAALLLERITNLESILIQAVNMLKGTRSTNPSKEMEGVRRMIEFRLSQL